MSGDLRALLERVREAKGAEDALDAEIARAFGWHQLDRRHGSSGGDWVSPEDWRAKSCCEGWVSTPDPPEFTASIDAALALVERCLPDANCYGVERQGLDWEAYVSRNHVPSGHWMKEGFSLTPALAILSALLSALLARAEEREGEGDR